MLNDWPVLKVMSPASEKLLTVRRLIGQGEGGGAEVVAADADVAEPGVALLVGARALRRPVVGHDGEVDVGLLGPGLRGLEDDVLPLAGQAGLAVEGREQVARDAAARGWCRRA